MKLHQVSGKRHYGVMLTFTSTIFWGILPIVFKVLVEKMDVFTIVWFRLLGAAIIVSFYIIRKYGFAPVFKIKGLVFFMTIITIIGLGGNYVTYALGIKYMTPGMAVVMIQLAPMMLMLGGIIIFREKFRSIQWIGLVVLLAGLIFFFHNRIREIFSGLNNISIGVIIIIFSAFLWAAYAMVQKQLLRYFPSEIVIARIYIGGVIFFFPLSHPSRILNLDPAQLGLLAFSSINTVIAYGCFSEALEHLEVSRIGLITAITPLVTLSAATGVAALLPGYISPENLDKLSIIGACLVVAGSMIGSYFSVKVPQAGKG